MKVRIFQKGFNYSQDGTGNRLVYHLQGCNLKCPWCANPEGMPPEGALLREGDGPLKDTTCPFGAIKNGTLSLSLCKGCKSRACVSECGETGLRLSDTESRVEEILHEISRCRPMFYDEGGVTFTGGEPTLQFEALKSLLEGCRRIGVHTTIETNATSPFLPKLFPLIDQLIMDFKHYDGEKHLAATGALNDTVKKNLKLAFGHHPNVHIRIPVIGGFNNSPQDIESFADFFRRYDPGNAAFEALAYHEFGKVKWEQCGWEYLMKDAFVSPETMKAFETVFTGRGLRYEHT